MVSYLSSMLACISNHKLLLRLKVVSTMEILLKMYPKECSSMVSPVMVTLLDVCMKDYAAMHHAGQDAPTSGAEPPFVICG
jgi:hypothetical protein